MGTVPSAEQLLDGAVAAARAGGAALVQGLKRPREVQLKNERSSIVTAVDLAAQREILRVIADRFPDHAVLAEEGEVDVTGTGAHGDRTGHGVLAGEEHPRATASEAPFTWLVDPLDGTSNYAHGLPFACSSVAVRDSDGVVAGAIVEPFRGELFTASRGGGAWLGDERLAVSGTGSLGGALVCTGIQSDDEGAIAGFGRRMVALSRSCRAVRCLGSPALCLAYVAAGRIDAFVERDATYAWDVGAGALLITEAGGRIEDLDGGPVNLGPGLANVIATNRAIHGALAELVHAAELVP